MLYHIVKYLKYKIMKGVYHHKYYDSILGPKRSQIHDTGSTKSGRREYLNSVLRLRILKILSTCIIRSQGQNPIKNF